MEYGGAAVDDFLSPESTVTSLLSSSGHLRSGLLPPEHDSTFRYRNKEYDSASAALDAYIADFEGGCQSCMSTTGRLVLPHSPASTPRRPRLSTLRNKDVLRESLSERELNFLNLPVSSLHHNINRDRLSMTTDELLNIPQDGSMPITHTSAFLQGLLFQSGSSTARQNHSLHPHTIHSPRSSRCGGKTGAVSFKTLDDSLSRFKSASASGPPHWFSRTKSEPEYTSWLQSCEGSQPPPPPESDLWDERGFPPPAVPRTGAPSWVEELEDDDPDQTRSQVYSQQTLRDLRLQFAEQISLLAAERKSCDTAENLFRDSRLESLIQKADHVLNSLSQSCEGAGRPAVSPMKTEELLSSPFTLDSGGGAGGAGGGAEELSHRGAETLGGGLHGDSIWSQPGPVEALKQMLFRLQAVEAKLQRREEEASAAPPEEEPEGDAEPESFSGGLSLHRALHHLNRLKLLVEEPREKRREEEEKEEDEGLFSSSSADGSRPGPGSPGSRAVKDNETSPRDKKRLVAR